MVSLPGLARAASSPWGGIEEEAKTRNSRGLTGKHLSKKGVSLHIIRPGEQKEARKDPAASDGGAGEMEVFCLSGREGGQK